MTCMYSTCTCRSYRVHVCGMVIAKTPLQVNLALSPRRVVYNMLYTSTSLVPSHSNFFSLTVKKRNRFFFLQAKKKKLGRLGTRLYMYVHRVYELLYSEQWFSES